MAATGTPIVFIGTGEHLLDLERFAPEAFISKLLGMGDLGGLVEHVQSLKLDQKDTMKHIQEGIFTVRDLRDQLGNIMKMGPLSKMAGMIPGLSQMMGDVGDEEGSMKLKRMIYIMDSMTEKELDSDAKCFVDQPTRMTRIARGSGTSVREVEDVLTQHRMMATMAKKMGKGMANLQKGGAPQNKQQMAAMQRRMQSMGGGAGAGGPGGMDMGAMMRALGGAGGAGGGAGGMGGLGGLAGALGGGANPFAGMDMGAMQNMMKSMMGGGGMPGMPNMELVKLEATRGGPAAAAWGGGRGATAAAARLGGGEGVRRWVMESSHRGASYDAVGRGGGSPA